MNVKGQAIKITALYERLSDEDGYQGTSGSIINQQQILEEYAKKNGFENIRHFADDGLKGTARRPRRGLGGDATNKLEGARTFPCLPRNVNR